MPFYAKLEESLVAMPGEIGEKPKAILMISAHWEEEDFALQANPRPGMIYDYGGFPEHTYHVSYPAPGSPELAARVSQLIARAGFATHLDTQRGFDHGMYSPLVPMYPKADVPVIQLSIREDYDPRAHIEMGRALSPLREEGILIVGSGLSYHNLRLFNNSAAAEKASREFDEWLQGTLLRGSPEEKAARLEDWERAPSARLAHPREDHLIPLMVAFGAAVGDAVTLSYHEDNFMGALSVSSFRFG